MAALRDSLKGSAATAKKTASAKKPAAKKAPTKKKSAA